MEVTWRLGADIGMQRKAIQRGIYNEDDKEGAKVMTV
jgi:hypothetical protein